MGEGRGREAGSGGDTRRGSARLDARNVFCEMVRGEIRGGRVSPARQARIISLAAEIDIPDDEAIELIAQCCREAVGSGDPVVIEHAHRMSQARATAARVLLIVAVIGIGGVILLLL